MITREIESRNNGVLHIAEGLVQGPGFKIGVPAVWSGNPSTLLQKYFAQIKDSGRDHTTSNNITRDRPSNGRDPPNLNLVAISSD